MTDPLAQAWDDSTKPGASSNPLGQSQSAAAAAPASSSLDAAWNGTSGASAASANSGALGGSTPAATPNQTPATVQQTLGVGTSSPGIGQPGGPSESVQYSQPLAAVQNATSPQDLLTKQDQLARSVMANLQAAGHQVTWDGQHLTVDGRPYEVAGQNAPMADVAGFVTSKLQDPNYSSAKYTPAAKTFSQALAATGLDPSTARGNLGPIAIYAQLNGFPNAQAVGDDKIDFGDGNGPIDVLTTNNTFWFQNGTDRPGGGGAGGGFGDGSGGGGSAAASLQGITGERPDYNALWSISPTSTYTPGQIGDENMPGFTYESLIADQQKNPVQAATDASVNNLLANPDSLDPHTVATMEAKDAEEQQLAAQQQDTALKRFGYQGGITDSPWLASERAATARSGDQSIIANRRNIELTAAQTNKADERAAAAVGMQYQGQRSQQQMQAVSNAVDGAMKKATETSNRFSINENLKVEAAKLSLTADQLREQYVNDTLQDMTKRYGIDLGVKVDAAKLAEQSDEFKADLVYKVAALKQQDEQFGANLGLGYDTLNSNNLNKYWDGTTTAA